MITAEGFRSVVAESSAPLGCVAIPNVVAPFVFEFVIGSVIIEAAYDASRSGELMVTLRQESQTDPAFELADVLRVTECPMEEYHRYELMQPLDEQVLARLLRSAFGSIAKHGSEFLAGSPNAFERARQDRSERAATFTHSVNDARRLQAANTAWAVGDMAGVVEELQPIHERLTARDERRLAYALRQREKPSSS